MKGLFWRKRNAENGERVSWNFRLSLRWIYAGLFALFLTIFALTASVACYTPYSGRAYLERGIAPVFSQLNGNISEIYCADGDSVCVGTPIFKLDDTLYLAETARLEALYTTTENHLLSMDYQIEELIEKWKKSKQEVDQYRSDLIRDHRLWEQKIIAKTVVEADRLKYDSAVQDCAMLEKQIRSLQLSRGIPGENNSELCELRAELAVARKNLAETVVRAPIAGTVNYHQLYRGQAVVQSECYAMIDDSSKLIVNVDLMEKSVATLQTGQSALIAFDAIPGRVFHGRIDRFIQTLSSGYTGPNTLHAIVEDTRWIRAVGRNRVQLTLSESLPEGVPLATGAKASVSILNENFPHLSAVSSHWMTMVGWLNYVY